MYEYLIKKFVKNSEDVKNKEVRLRYGYLGSVFGIVMNVILFCIKMIFGFVANSIAIIADSFNNLSDLTSSLISLFSFKLTSKPADKEHPFGHGRSEYISALAVAILVILVGIEFLKTSFNRVIAPELVEFSWVVSVILMISMLLKLYMSIFTKKIADKINSKALMATSVDSRNDVYTTGVVLIGYLMAPFVSFPLDGYVGIAISLFILYNGFMLTKDVISSLMGEPADPELVEAIKEAVLSYETVIGVHDLIVHSYGPGRLYASIHAEVAENSQLGVVHERIDQAEKEIYEQLGVNLTVHMDPIKLNCERTQLVREIVQVAINEIDEEITYHDLRVVVGDKANNVVFDIVLPHKYEDTEQIKEAINQKVKEKDGTLNCVIEVDRDYL